jgi:hypothetical protein
MQRCTDLNEKKHISGKVKCDCSFSLEIQLLFLSL